MTGIAELTAHVQAQTARRFAVELGAIEAREATRGAGVSDDDRGER